MTSIKNDFSSCTRLLTNRNNGKQDIVSKTSRFPDELAGNFKPNLPNRNNGIEVINVNKTSGFLDELAENFKQIQNVDDARRFLQRNYMWVLQIPLLRDYDGNSYNSYHEYKIKNGKETLTFYGANPNLKTSAFVAKPNQQIQQIVIFSDVVRFNDHDGNLIMRLVRVIS